MAWMKYPAMIATAFVIAVAVNWAIFALVELFLKRRERQEGQ